MLLGENLLSGPFPGLLLGGGGVLVLLLQQGPLGRSSDRLGGAPAAWAALAERLLLLTRVALLVLVLVVVVVVGHVRVTVGVVLLRVATRQLAKML